VVSIVTMKKEIENMPQETFRRVCSWCNSLLDLENGPLAPKDKITHTVCPACEEKVLASLDDDDDKDEVE